MNQRRTYLPLFVGIALYLIYQITILFVFLGLDDELNFSYQSQLIVNGFVPYRDFFLHTTPASYYIVAFFYKIIGEYMVVDKVLGAGLYLLTLCVCYIFFPLRSYWRYVYILALAVLFVGP